MTYESFPNDDHNNRAVSLAEHEQIAAPLGLSGLLNYSGQTPVFGDSSGRQVKLRNGVRAIIRATRVNVTSETIISIGANASGNTRIDLVVLRLRRTESGVGAGDQYTISPVVITGTPGANPVAPSPVRDDTLDGTGFWDLPLAEVTVTNGATTITSGQVVNRAWWISGDGYTGFDAARPPAEPGVTFRANDTGILYVATSTSTWKTLYYNTGWVNVTGGQHAAGWEYRSFAVARDGNTCTLVMYIYRFGAAIGANTVQNFGPLPRIFWPTRGIYSTWTCRQGGTPLASYFAIAVDGTIVLISDASHVIPQGGQVLGSASWIVSDV